MQPFGCMNVHTAQQQAEVFGITPLMLAASFGHIKAL